jgi:hypothetical protein
MAIPTISHVDQPDPGECPCGPRLCARCAHQLQRLQADADLKRWVEVFGTVPDERAPKR